MGSARLAQQSPQLRLETDQGSEVVDAPEAGLCRCDLRSTRPRRPLGFASSPTSVEGETDGVQVQIAEVADTERPRARRPCRHQCPKSRSTWSSCSAVGPARRVRSWSGSFRCDDIWVSQRRRRRRAARDLRLDTAGSYEPAMTASLRPSTRCKHQCRGRAPGARANQLGIVAATCGRSAVARRWTDAGRPPGSRASDDAQAADSICRWARPRSRSPRSTPAGCRGSQRREAREFVLRAGDAASRGPPCRRRRGCFDAAPGRPARDLDCVASAPAYSLDGGPSSCRCRWASAVSRSRLASAASRRSRAHRSISAVGVARPIERRRHDDPEPA